jgi:hypothetical protein
MNDHCQIQAREQPAKKLLFLAEEPSHCTPRLSRTNQKVFCRNRKVVLFFL